MPGRTRFYDLRKSGVAWELPIASNPWEITTPAGEELVGVNLPGASLCADFLVDEKIGLWTGVTVAVHPRDIPYVKSAFELVDDSMTRLILPHEARVLSRYRDDSGWAWLEVRWITTEDTRMQMAQTNQALWYCLKKSFKRRQQVVVLALENLDYMFEELGPKFQLPPLRAN
jgi:hypothetical protein